MTECCQFYSQNLFLMTLLFQSLIFALLQIFGHGKNSGFHFRFVMNWVDSFEQTFYRNPFFLTAVYFNWSIKISKFYGKVGVISCLLFHLIWKNYLLYWGFSLKNNYSMFEWVFLRVVVLMKYDVWVRAVLTLCPYGKRTDTVSVSVYTTMDIK